MAVRITHKRLSSGSGHEHITHLAWTNEQSNESSSSTRAVMVQFVDDNAAGAAYTREGERKVLVGSVHPSSGEPYIRTYSDGQWTNNLLALPDF